MRIRRHITRIACAVMLAALALPRPSAAQSLISAGVGVGAAVGTHNSGTPGSNAHALGFAQLHPPLLPFAVRADALISQVEHNGTSLSLIGDAVFFAPLPIVQPYVLVGYGTYGVGKNENRGGANAGVGVRVKVPSLTLFAEARRHQRISHDLLTIGIAL